MPLRAFSEEVGIKVRLNVLGLASQAPDGQLSSDYSSDPNQLQQGEKGFQIRIWQVEDNGTSDSNATFQVAGVEIEILRKLFAEEDERHYTENGEMINDMERLLDQASWTDLNAASVYFEGDTPSIDGVPERTDQVVSYVVTFTMQLIA